MRRRSGRGLAGEKGGALCGPYLRGQRGSGWLGKHGPAWWDGRADELVASTMVSRTLLSRIAAAAGAQYAETLTGFKWIMRAGDTRERLRFAFGYEEALGYAVTDVVRDKDGIGAALALLGLAAVARSDGESLIDAYDRLEATYGVHATAQVTVPTTRPIEVMARLRAEPPTVLAGNAVISMTDLMGGSSELPSSDVLTYRLASGPAVIPRGRTQPK